MTIAGPVLGDRAVSFAYPSAGLDAIVERYWRLEAGRPLTVDLWPGTGAEILWPTGPAAFVSAGRTSPIAGPVLLTLRARPARVVLPGDTSVFAVRLRASALARLGIRPGRHLDGVRPIGSVAGLGSGAAEARGPQSLLEGRAHVEAALARLRDRTPPPRIATSVEAYYRAPATMTVPEAAALAAVSERQLRRDFVLAVGVGPKRFQRLVRFQRTFRSLLLDGPRALDPHGVGYADQPHQLREFTAFAGSAPSAVRRAAPAHVYFRSRR